MFLLLVNTISFQLKSPFNISYKASFLVMNSFSFYQSENLFYLFFSSEWYLCQTEYSCLEGFCWYCCFVLFCCSTLNISHHSLLACNVSAEKSGDSLMGNSLHVTNYFSIAAYHILSLFLTFEIFIIMCLGVLSLCLFYS